MEGRVEVRHGVLVDRSGLITGIRASACGFDPHRRYMTSFWKSNWYEDSEPLDEGQRGGGERAGVAGFATFEICGEFLTYPACSKHGAMNKLGKERPIWRCLVTGCNVGTEVEAPLEHHLTVVT